MAKHPQWYSKSVTSSNTTPSKALKDAAKVIKAEAKGYRRLKNKDAALALERVAQSLEQVSEGQTWEHAFGLNSTNATPA